MHNNQEPKFRKEYSSPTVNILCNTLSVEKGRLVRIEICSLPSDIPEIEGVPCYEPVPISSSSFIAETDLTVMFVPNGGEDNG